MTRLERVKLYGWAVWLGLLLAVDALKELHAAKKTRPPATAATAASP